MNAMGSADTTEAASAKDQQPNQRFFSLDPPTRPLEGRGPPGGGGGSGGPIFGGSILGSKNLNKGNPRLWGTHSGFKLKNSKKNSKNVPFDFFDFGPLAKIKKKCWFDARTSL